MSLICFLLCGQPLSNSITTGHLIGTEKQNRMMNVSPARSQCVRYENDKDYYGLDVHVDMTNNAVLALLFFKEGQSVTTLSSFKM